MQGHHKGMVTIDNKLTIEKTNEVVRVHCLTTNGTLLAIPVTTRTQDDRDCKAEVTMPYQNFKEMREGENKA